MHIQGAIDTFLNSHSYKISVMYTNLKQNSTPWTTKIGLLDTFSNV